MVLLPGKLVARIVRFVSVWPACRGWFMGRGWLHRNRVLNALQRSA
jgi:hypothetical protein